MIALLIRLTRSFIQYLPLLTFFLFFMSSAQAQTVSRAECLYFPDVDSGCPVEFTLTATADGASIDTFADAEADSDPDYYFDITLEATFSGGSGAPGDSQSVEGYGGTSVELDDLISSNFPAQYSSTATVEACDYFDGDAESQNGVTPQEIVPQCRPGALQVSISATVPNVTSVSPNSVTIGTSGTLTLTGSNLIDMFGETPTLANIPGLALTLISVSNNQATVSYNTTSAGQFSVGLVGLFGEGTQQTFTVVDPTPTVTSVSPATWSAGTTVPITVAGSGFGTNPTLTILGPGVTGYAITGVSDTQLTANVTISASSPGGTATVQLQSNGYGGTGFLGSPGQSPDAMSAILIQALPAPPPKILFLTQNVAQTTQTVYIGQQIALTVPTDNLPPGLSVQSQSWSPIPGTAVGGFTVLAANCGSIPQSEPGDVCPSVLPLPGLTGSGITFYWTSTQNATQVTYTLRYTWVLNNGQSSSASVTFNVGGPTSVGGSTNAMMKATPGQVNVWPKGLAGGGATVPFLEFGNSDTNQGMYFQASAILPAQNVGIYSWVQTLGTDPYVWNSIGPVTPTAPTGVTVDTTGPGLDTSYPYNDIPGEIEASDSPGVPLFAYNGDENVSSFAATMYLMWTPIKDVACVDSKTNICAIPVPLSYVNWRFTGDAINTLLNSATDGWILGCGQTQHLADPPQPTSTYPVWTVTQRN